MYFIKCICDYLTSDIGLKNKQKKNMSIFFCGVSSEGKIDTFLPGQKWLNSGNFKHMVYNRGKSKNTLKDLAIKISFHQYVVYLGRNTMIIVPWEHRDFHFTGD